jgi:hypothetical protein
MTIYIVIAEGVSRHRIAGVTKDRIQAEQIARDAYNDEKDHYHDWLVIRMQTGVGRFDEEIVGRVKGEFNHGKSAGEWDDK